MRAGGRWVCGSTLITVITVFALGGVISGCDDSNGGGSSANCASCMPDYSECLFNAESADLPGCINALEACWQHNGCCDSGSCAEQCDSDKESCIFGCPDDDDDCLASCEYDFVDCKGESCHCIPAE